MPFKQKILDFFKNMNPILRVITLGFLSLIFISLILIIYAYMTLPNINKMIEAYDHVEPAVIYDINGDVIYKVVKENREVVTLDKIPKELQNAFICTEDKHFYSHHGFDLQRTFKAAAINLIKMRKAQGGSTLTQQLARNAFLSLEKTFMRKIKEAIITIELERTYSKDEILEKYLNEIYFGEGAYGVQTASKMFFNKNAADLNLAECALLAGIPNRPQKYSPIKHLENAKKRQELILGLMLNQGAITEKEYDKAIKYKIHISKNYQSKKIVSKAPEFTDLVIKELIDKFDEKAVYEDGLKVYTTLDLRMQKAALEAFNSSYHLKKFSELQGALITIDSNTGYIKAMVGGRDFITGNFNRAISAKRQPGSSFKPFVYFTALQQGIPMNKMIEDTPLTIGKWSPKNYDRSNAGSVTMAEALEKSKNIPTIRLLQKVSVGAVIKNCRLAGITSPIQSDYTIGLGSMSLTPLELSTAYASFSNGGNKITPITITRVEDKTGSVIFESKIESTKIFDSVDVAQIVKLMQNANIYGTGYAANIGIDQAGKTGTTSDYTDAWFAGFTPDLVTSIYFGYDNNKKMKSGMTGGEVAAPIWGKYMLKLVNRKIYKPTRFKFIDKAVSSGKLYSTMIDLETGNAATMESTRVRSLLFKPGKGGPAVVKESDIKPAEVTTESAATETPVEDGTTSESDVNNLIDKLPESSPSEAVGDSVLD